MMWKRNQMKRLVLIIFLLQELLFSQTVRFAIGEWEPYVGQMLPDYGPTTKIVSLACKRAGIKCEYQFYPWQRSFDMAVRNSDDIIGTFPWKATQERTDKMFYNGIPVLVSRDVIFYRKGVLPDSAKNDLVQLRGKRVLGLRGYVATQYLEEAGVKAHIVSTAETAWKMIAANRMDILVDSELVGLSECKKYAPDVCSQIRTSTPTNINKLGIYYTRIHDDSKTIMMKINTELEKMKKSGEIEKIYKESI